MSFKFLTVLGFLFTVQAYEIYTVSESLFNDFFYYGSSNSFKKILRKKFFFELTKGMVEKVLIIISVIRCFSVTR